MSAPATLSSDRCEHCGRNEHSVAPATGTTRGIGRVNLGAHGTSFLCWQCERAVLDGGRCPLGNRCPEGHA